MQAGTVDLKSEVLPPLHRQHLHSPILMLLLTHSILHATHLAHIELESVIIIIIVIMPPTLSQIYTHVSLTNLTAGDKLTRNFRKASVLVIMHKLQCTHLHSSH